MLHEFINVLFTEFDFKFPSSHIGLDGVGKISLKVSSVVIFVALLVVLTGMLAWDAMHEGT